MQSVGWFFWGFASRCQCSELCEATAFFQTGFVVILLSDEVQVQPQQALDERSQFFGVGFMFSGSFIDVNRVRQEALWKNWCTDHGVWRWDMANIFQSIGYCPMQNASYPRIR